MVLYPCLFHCVLGGVLHCPRAISAPSPGSSGTFEAAVHRLEIHCAELPVVLVEVGKHGAHGSRIGNDRLQMECSRGGERAGADVSLDADIVDIGHIADLLALRQAAAVAQIRLDDLNRLILKEGGVLPAGVESFTVEMGTASLSQINLVV